MTNYRKKEQTRAPARVGFLWVLCVTAVSAQRLLIPMDLGQTDHLKSYGVAYHALEKGISVEWLLNFRGGAFLMNPDDGIISECRRRVWLIRRSPRRRKLISARQSKAPIWTQ